MNNCRVRFQSLIQRVGYWGARPEIFFFSCAWLIVLLVAGTWAQRSIGLYQAQQQFFSCFITWIGPVPTPGGYTVMGLVFLGLVTKIGLKSPLSWKKLGIAVCHLGGLLLLLGGFLTALFSREGNMVLQEGGSADFYSDYHKTEFVVTDTSQAEHDPFTSFGPGWLHTGKALKHERFPFVIHIQQCFSNVIWVRRETPEGGAYKGFLKIFNLIEAPPNKEAEKNVSGCIFEVSGAGEEKNGTYGIFEGMPIPQTVRLSERTYVLSLQRARMHLPFRIHLIDFEKKMHPATNIAKSYQSTVEVMDGAFTQKKVIQMNEPLRYKGYTFYQASFIEEGGAEISVLAVVKNAGRLFPYISSIIMCLGIILNLIANASTLFRSATPKKRPI